MGICWNIAKEGGWSDIVPVRKVPVAAVAVARPAAGTIAAAGLAAPEELAWRAGWTPGEMAISCELAGNSTREWRVEMSIGVGKGESLPEEVSPSDAIRG